MKRFYKDVSVVERNGAHEIRLDGKPVKTPLKKPLALPTPALASAVAQEWSAQGSDIEPMTMALTRLANTAIDRAPAQRELIAGEILKYGDGDLLCYRAEEKDLAARQSEAWDPILDWLAEHHYARLQVTIGMSHVPQPADALLALGQTVTAQDDFALAALHAATTATGSLALALALFGGRLDAEQAFALSRLDEAWQSEKWGTDKETAEQARSLARDLESAVRFMDLSRP